jgi:hypothetical protein
MVIMSETEIDSEEPRMIGGLPCSTVRRGDDWVVVWGNEECPAFPFRVTFREELGDVVVRDPLDPTGEILYRFEASQGVAPV